MSKKYIAVVKNGAIRIETPELEEGETVEVIVEKSINSESENCFEKAAQLRINEFPENFSVTHKELPSE